MKIFKYHLRELTNPVELPFDAKPLSVGYDGESKLSVWVLLDENEVDKRKFHFEVFGTGWNIEGETGEYLGTTLCQNSGLVWHVFFTKKTEHVR